MVDVHSAAPRAQQRYCCKQTPPSITRKLGKSICSVDERPRIGTGRGNFFFNLRSGLGVKCSLCLATATSVGSYGNNGVFTWEVSAAIQESGGVAEKLGACVWESLTCDSSLVRQSLSCLTSLGCSECTCSPSPGAKAASVLSPHHTHISSFFLLALHFRKTVDLAIWGGQ